MTRKIGYENGSRIPLKSVTVVKIENGGAQSLPSSHRKRFPLHRYTVPHLQIHNLP